ncbi:MAG: glycosyltransferase family 4 protein [Patescibacteria group bacterium]|nr:glycosyltransferase family 4 protein [Patescibacteria group bacterium]
MKIKFITTKLNLVDGGGSNANVHMKAKVLCEKGHEVAVVTMFSQKNQIKESTPYKLIQENLKSGKHSVVRKKTRDILKKYEDSTDVYHVDGHMFVWGAGLYKKEGGKVPIIAHFDNYLLTMGVTQIGKMSLRAGISFKLLRLWELLIGLRQADLIDKFTCASKTTLKIYAKHGFDKQKMMTIPAFMDLEVFKNLNRENVNEKNLLYIGRIHLDKGLDVLLKAIKDIENITLDLVGSGPDEENLKKMAENLGINNKVFFHGWKSPNEVIKYFEKAKIFVHPALWPEPFGMAVVEAMAAGIPVITTEGTGSTEIVGDTGLRFTKKNSKQLKKNIEKLLNSDRLYKELSKKAKDRAQEYDYRRWSDFLEKQLTEIR